MSNYKLLISSQRPRVMSFYKVPTQMESSQTDSRRVLAPLRHPAASPAVRKTALETYAKMMDTRINRSTHDVMMHPSHPNGVDNLPSLTATNKSTRHISNSSPTSLIVAVSPPIVRKSTDRSVTTTTSSLLTTSSFLINTSLTTTSGHATTSGGEREHLLMYRDGISSKVYPGESLFARDIRENRQSEEELHQQWQKAGTRPIVGNGYDNIGEDIDEREHLLIYKEAIPSRVYPGESLYAREIRYHVQHEKELQWQQKKTRLSVGSGFDDASEVCEESQSHPNVSESIHKTYGDVINSSSSIRNYSRSDLHHREETLSSNSESNHQFIIVGETSDLPRDRPPAETARFPLVVPPIEKEMRLAPGREDALRKSRGIWIKIQQLP